MKKQDAVWHIELHKWLKIIDDSSDIHALVIYEDDGLHVWHSRTWPGTRPASVEDAVADLRKIFPPDVIVKDHWTRFSTAQ